VHLPLLHHVHAFARGVEGRAAQSRQSFAAILQRSRKIFGTPIGVAAVKRLHQLLAHPNTQR